MTMLIAFAPPAANAPPPIVAAISVSGGQPCSAMTIAGRVVMRSSSMIRGFVRAMYAPTRVVGVRLTPCTTPPGDSRDGTRGRAPTDITRDRTTWAGRATNVG